LRKRANNDITTVRTMGSRSRVSVTAILAAMSLDAPLPELPLLLRFCD